LARLFPHSVNSISEHASYFHFPPVRAPIGNLELDGQLAESNFKGTNIDTAYTLETFLLHPDGEAIFVVFGVGMIAKKNR
jgi:hypothetical protein